MATEEIHAKIWRFADLLRESKRIEHERRGYVLAPPEVKVTHGRRYTRVDVGGSGAYMVDENGDIFGIKGYGVIHRQHRYGNLDTIEDWNWGGYQAGRLPK